MPDWGKKKNRQEGQAINTKYYQGGVEKKMEKCICFGRDELGLITRREGCLVKETPTSSLVTKLGTPTERLELSRPMSGLRVLLKQLDPHSAMLAGVSLSNSCQGCSSMSAASHPLAQPPLHPLDLPQASPSSVLSISLLQQRLQPQVSP